MALNSVIEGQGQNPKRSFTEALKNTVEWYVENESWWRKQATFNSYSSYYMYRVENTMEKLIERELIVPVRFSKREIETIDKTVERVGAKSRSALIREATQKYLQEVGSLKVIEIRKNVTLKDAKAEILTYLREHKEAETFDIANDLRLDLDLTVRALKDLWEEGRVA